MANVKISDLTAVAASALSDVIPVVQSATTKRATLTQVRVALLPIVLTADVSGTLPEANGGTGIAALGSGVATFLGTPSGANLGSALSSALAANKVVQATGTGIPHVVSGALSAASSLVVNADVDAAAAIAGSKVAPDFGAQNVVTTGYVSAGATPATNGTIRLPQSATIKSGVANEIALETSAATLFLGTNSGYSQRFDNVALYAGAAVHMGIAGATYFSCYYTGIIKAAVPVVGDTDYSSPYGVHGGVTHSFASDASYVVTAAKYALERLDFDTGSWGSGHTVTFPAPATKAAGYTKTIINRTVYTMTVSTGAGSTVNIATARGQRLSFDDGGVEPAGGVFTL